MEIEINAFLGLIAIMVMLTIASIFIVFIVFKLVCIGSKMIWEGLSEMKLNKR